VLHFIQPNWPDIGVVDVLPPLLSYQGEAFVRRVSGWLGVGAQSSEGKLTGGKGWFGWPGVAKLKTE